MALPALILAPFAALVGGLASKLLDGVINLFTRKFLIHAALIVLFVSIYGVFMAAINSMISGLNWGTMPQILIDGFATLPSNTDDCIALIISTKLAAMAFNIQREILDIRKA